MMAKKGETTSMKKFARRFTCLLLTLSLLPLSALGVVQTREWGDFPDVPSDHWAHSYVKSLYRYYLMSGTGGGLFTPNGTLTVAEAVTTAVRAHYFELGETLVLDQSTGNWYDSAVNEALELGILTPGQFDSYTRPATRAELAGLLAVALPEDTYEAINNVTSLPDVDPSTPYSQAIFKLYNAGILTGSDGYGTFHPEQNITRVELSALLYRLVFPHSRRTLVLAAKANDLTVYSSSKRLMVEGFPVYGLTVIDGRYYLPLALLQNDSTSAAYLLRGYDYGSSCSISIGSGYSSYREIPLLDYWAVPPEGKVMGVADPDPLPLDFNGTQFAGGIRTIGGDYPMADLALMGAVEQGGDLVLELDLAHKEVGTPVPESDLPGGPMSLVKRDTDRETLKAIHDYLVDLLTYSILTEAPRGTTEEEFANARALFEQAGEKYLMSTNIALDTKYGVCEDYAELFQNMCIRAGFPCEIVIGSAGGPHSWNRVYLDGQWYYVDCTWDDPLSRTPIRKHTYFLVDAETMVKSHYWEDEDYPMPAEYDPAWEELDPNNITSADMFRKCLVAQMVIANRTQGYGERTVTLRVTKSGAYGGTGCIYAYPEAYWWTFSGGYDSATGAYVYHFD